MTIFFTITCIETSIKSLCMQKSFSFFVRILFIFTLCQVSPLHKAAEGGHVNVVKYLVDKEADINVKKRDHVST